MYSASRVPTQPWRRLVLMVVLMIIVHTTSFRYPVNNYHRTIQTNQFSSRKQLLIVMMASKDGKSKKKRKDTGTSDSSPTTTTATSKPLTSSAQRVSNQINVPIRQQIAWAKAYKRLMSAQGPGGGATGGNSTPRKFRQQNEPRDAPEEYVEIDYVNTNPPAVFVDGYNIIGYINTAEGRTIDLEDARDCLIR